MSPVKAAKYRDGIRRANEHYEFYSYVRKTNKKLGQTAFDIFWAWHEWDLENEPRLSRLGKKAFVRRFTHLRTRDLMEALS